ncbi:hypothetical protein [Marinobacter sp. AL4B]|uniref:hypothetical protein n=1 Tax=Marinobacter sp. AL4B TaxID=2871173 RepID=UPI001CAA4660|nr:hypothetical protein [Marinobacter sp. AL4B]MBZ0335301.1 hypothetical protein [Marinobacter sp. AL4B]
MKQFSFESSSSQRDELIALTKGSYLSDASLKNLCGLVLVLRKYLQESKPGTFIREDLRLAVENTEATIQLRRSEKTWFEKPIGLIGISLFVTILGGLYVLHLAN